MPISNFSNLTINPRFTNSLEVNEILEGLVNLAPSSSSAFNFDYSAGNIFHSTASVSANYTINITNAPTINEKIFTINHIHPQSPTGYRPGELNINGASVQIRWAGGITPTPTSASVQKIDIFTFTIYRRSGAYTALASANLNF